ncbi:MAG: metallophosphoesterase family protein [Minisyncoccia bacterium]
MVIKKNAIPHIIKEFKKREVEMIVHCGDIESKHVSSELFGDLPVVCALVDGQNLSDPAFNDGCPVKWKFTFPEKRVHTLSDGTVVYIGHKKHLEFLKATEEKFNEILTDLRHKFDGLRMVFGGHLHFQTYKQGHLVSFINPGAVQDALGWGYEFAVIDTAIEQVVFSRVLPMPDDRPTFSVGVISDSLDVSHQDKNFWLKLAQEFDKRGVQHIIHCGNLSLEDIGRKELSHFSTVYYAIRADQKADHDKLSKSSAIPGNWKVIAEKDLDEGATVVINNYRFFVQLDLGLKFMTVSEVGMDTMAMQIRRKHPETQFVLCGFTREALLVEGQLVTTINPGDANTDRCFAVICLPRKEITFGHVPYDPLPVLTN